MATLDLVLLLSPAHCGGRRAKSLMRPGSAMPLACALRDGTLTLGEAFTFMSSLYFRGKLAYARAFTPPGRDDRLALVITPTRGLQSPGMPVSIGLLEEFAATDIAASDPRYRAPLERDLGRLASQLAPTARVVLLGSVATDKYVDVLVPQLGDRLYYPPTFVGRGDMSRGGLLLRSADSGIELDYEPLTHLSTRHGARPPKLEARARAGRVA
jgi:hypothetical protein